MFEKRTTIVIGAGASKELGLPLGNELTTQIAGLLDFRFKAGQMIGTGDGGIQLAVERLTSKRRTNGQQLDRNDLWQAARRIAVAMPQAASIDAFIDAHDGNESIRICGKLAIVTAILNAEKKSLLYTQQDKEFRPEKLNGTWLRPFWHLLTDGPKQDLPRRLARLSLIVFNYDRCVEQYLYLALQNYYGMAREDAASLVQMIGIYHPYGVIGHLPWQLRKPHVNFGADPRDSDVLDLISGLRTYTEEADPTTSDISSVRRRILEANVVVFLGFAFHRSNMALLTATPDDYADGGVVPRTYYATAKGFSDVDKGQISKVLAALCSAQVDDVHVMNRVDGCADLFDTHRFALRHS